MKIDGMLAMVAGLAMAGCASQPAAYTEHDPRFVGTWYIADVSPFDTSYFEKTYFPDGHACGYIISTAADGVKFSLFTSTWKIESGKLISTPITSNDPYIPVGVPIVDEIKGVTPSVMSLRAAEGGDTYKRYRYPEDRGYELCNLHDPSQPQTSDRTP